jgi:hypothetical protein
MQPNPSSGEDKPLALTECEQEAQEEGRIGIGYWLYESYYDSMPEDKKARRAAEVEGFIVKGWNETPEAQAVIAFMKAGEVVSRYRGFAMDRLDGEHLGSTCLAHGRWQYPDKWWRYIEKHSVKPWNEDFIREAVEWSNQQPI